VTILSAISDSPITQKLADYLAGRPTESRSPHWPKTRRVYLLTHGACAICGYTLHLNVHHIKPFHLFPALELDPTNFITLGEKCPTGNHHFLFGHFGDWTKWNPDIELLARFILANFGQQRAKFDPIRLSI
jgi:5-methylcytosine-specific restriction endonuclease McrA